MTPSAGPILPGNVPGKSPGSNQEIRPAATIMLVRDGVGQPGSHEEETVLEVLMVQRNLKSDFVGGAFVFPGGAVDPADGGAAAQACCPARDDAAASRILGVEAGGLAYWVAVIRESFEEAGVLLASHLLEDSPDHASSVGRGHDAVLSFDDEVLRHRFARHRHALNEGTRSFLDICVEEHISLAVDQIHYFAHWITPEGAPRRYDTRFFVAAAPPEQVAIHDDGETIAARWIRPLDALALHQQGEIELIFPTIRNLQAIARFDRSQDLLDAAAGASEIPAILPRVVADGRGVRIVLPGDPGYEDLAAPDAAPADFNEVVRQISHAANPVPDVSPPRPH